MKLKRTNFFYLSNLTIACVITLCSLLFTQVTTIFAIDATDAIGTLTPTPGIKGNLTTPDAKFDTLTPKATAENPEATSGLIQFINIVLSTLAIVAGAALLFNIVAAGLSIILHPLKPGKLMEAVKRILLSILGIVLIALGWFVVAFVSQTLFGNSDFLLSPQLNATPIPTAPSSI